MIDALSPSLMNALGSLPVTLIQRGEAAGTLPLSSPPGSALKALERRELAEFNGRAWVRTVLGEAVWGRR